MADAVFIHANIWTVDSSRPTAHAVAVKDGRIVAVGADEEVAPFTGDGTRVIDVRGKLMLPGFIDGHTHFMSGGFQLQSVDLRNSRNEEEFSSRIKERAAKFPGRWI